MKHKYESAHKLSSNHRDQLKSGIQCGCFYCLHVFSSSEIQDWIDNEQTAVCPYCGIDSVIYDHLGFQLTESFLQGMHHYWF